MPKGLKNKVQWVLWRGKLFKWFKLFWLRGNTGVTAKKRQFSWIFFVKTNSLYELLSLYMYILSTYIYEIIKKNSLNNINICSLSARWCALRLKKHGCTGARASSERELWNKFFFILKYINVVSWFTYRFFIKLKIILNKMALFLKKKVAILRQKIITF